MQVTVSISEDGVVTFTDADGEPLPDALERQFKKQHGEQVREVMKEEADSINAAAHSIADVHLLTLPPDMGAKIARREFTTPAPKRPQPATMGWLKKLFFPKKKRELDERNAAQLLAYQSALDSWKTLRRVFEEKEDTRISRLEQLLHQDVSRMEEFLGEYLQSIAWPRETMIDFSVLDDGSGIFIDVDLPEIGDMPTRQASLPKRGWKISIKELSDRERRVMYMRHIHGIGFRILGEVFRILPSIQIAVLSGYSQRINRQTGNIQDEYLYSVRVKRSNWAEINFDRLNAVDPVAAFQGFELRREMTKTGLFKPIQPFA